MRDGMLVGYVPQIDGSEDFGEAQVVDAIARTDYDQPIARQRSTVPPAAPPLTPRVGSSAASWTASATADQVPDRVVSLPWPGLPGGSSAGGQTEQIGDVHRPHL